MPRGAATEPRSGVVSLLAKSCAGWHTWSEPVQRFLSLALAVAAIPAVYAEVLDPIVVTATRIEAPLSEITSSVIVIDRDQIERSVATDIAELLRFHAGLELGRNGGPGQPASLFIRGTESNHALVLINGVEMNPGTIGGAALQNIAPAQIDRIEIVKGPRSSLYGSEAIGGVVNVITRRDERFSARAMAGPYKTREIGLAGGYRGDAGLLSMSAGHSRSDGFATRSGENLPDRGFDNLSLGLNGRLEAGLSSLSVRHWQSSGTTEYLDFFLSPLSQDYLNRATALNWETSPRDNWHSDLTFSQVEDRIDQLESDDFVRTVRDVLEWENRISGGAHQLVAGLYLSTEHTDSLSFGTGFDETTAVNAVFVEDVIEFDRNRLLLALRRTDHEFAGLHTTYNIELGRSLTQHWQLVASAGTAFRAADATDRFGFGGNPMLDPEQSRSYELGLRSYFANQQFSAQYFHTEIDDLIEFIFDPQTLSGRNVNIAQARIRGVELSYRRQQGDWELGGSALLQDPEDRLNAKQLARRARNQLTLRVARHFGRHTIGMDVLATSARPDSPFSDAVNRGYVLANLNTSLQLAPGWQLHGRIENLLDTNYQLASGYLTPGRGLYLGIRYQSR